MGTKKSFDDMAYELFYSPGACSLAAHILLEEVGVDFVLHEVSVVKGETQREPYLSINPKGRVPVLRIESEPEILTELPAILLYLGRRHSEHELIPRDPLRQARCDEWLAWLAGWVHGVGFGLLWRPERFSTDSEHGDSLTTRAREVIETAYSDIEKRLADGRVWALGESFSMVDPFLLVLYRWGNRIDWPMQDRYPAWAALTQRTAERPAVARALQTEGVRVEA